MSMGSSDSQGAITEINVTPLVDVCLVLVIIFMVIAPFTMQAGIEIATSRVGAAKGKSALKDMVNVVLDGKGIIKINGKKVNWDQLGEALRKALEHSRERKVALNASPEASVGQVVEILDISKQNGARGLAILNPK